MKVKFSNAEVDVWKLRKGSLVFSPNKNAFYYVQGFKNLMDNNPILHLEPCDGGDIWYISTCLLEWLEPH